jgi:hypothetical protein
VPRERAERERNLIVAALRYSVNEHSIRTLTRQIHQSRCQNSPACWAQAGTEAWRDPQAETPETYCDDCVRSTILARERHGLKLQRGGRRETLLRAAAVFQGSNYAASAGPSPGSGGVSREVTGGRPCIHPSIATTLA